MLFKLVIERGSFARLDQVIKEFRLASLPESVSIRINIAKSRNINANPTIRMDALMALMQFFKQGHVERGDKLIIATCIARLKDQDSGWMINTGWPLIEG